MRALISGEAAAAMILDKDVEYRPLGAAVITGFRPSDVDRAFEGCADVRISEVRNHDHADNLVKQAWAEDRALRLFLFLLDHDETHEDLKDYAECVEELLEIEGVMLSLERRMLSNELPIPLEVKKIEQAAENCMKTLGVFHRVISLQRSIRVVCSAFNETDECFFGNSFEKRRFREQLIDEGLFRDVVMQVDEGQDLGFVRLKIAAKFRGHAAAAQAFLSKIQPLSKMPREMFVQEEAEETYSEYEEDRDGDYVAYMRVKAQQKGIIDRLRLHDVNSARRYAAQLIADQKRISNKEHIAKSLCLLSREACHYELYDLQLEWAELANKIDSTDPMASGHLVDALIRVGRFVEAHAAIEETERRGDYFYAMTSKARIRRIEGNYREAYELYETAARLCADHGDVLHAWIGSADSLRSMNRFADAISLYEKAIIRWPNDGALRCHYAYALIEGERYYDAIKEYNIALQHGGGIVAESGRAAAFKWIGETEEALRLYDKILEMEPYNSAALCGRAEVFRVEDNFNGAFEAYLLATERAGYSPRAWGGLASVLTDLGQYERAKQIFEEAEQKFHCDEFIAAGKARVLRREGNLEDALRAFDELSQRFPFNMWLAWSVGDALRRMGHRRAAVEKMDRLLSKWPDYIPAKLSKAATLIEEGRFIEAGTLLNAEDGVSLGWSGYVLRAEVLRSSGKSKEALVMLSNCLSRSRLPRERRFIKCAIASLDLRQGRFQAAAGVAEYKSGEISNVIHFHALAASRDIRAGKEFEQLTIAHENKKYEGVVIEIARRYRLSSETPQHTLEWISEQEQKALLLEIV